VSVQVVVIWVVASFSVIDGYQEEHSVSMFGVEITLTDPFFFFFFSGFTALLV
jgi:hypothetical protein